MTTNQLILGKYDGLLCDLDGVVYAGPKAIPGAPEALQQLAARGAKIGYITNNASRSNQVVADHLSSLGAPAPVSSVFGSVEVSVALLQEHVPAGSAVLATGSEYLADSLTQAGYRLCADHHDQPAAVIQGFNPGLAWPDLAQASYVIANGAFWLATNLDLTIPTAEGIAPGNGTFVHAVATATGKKPLVAGKPEPHMFRLAATELGLQRPLVVGDRLDTDIVGGNRAGFDTALVLTGINTREDAAQADPEFQPTMVIESMGQLL